MKWNQFKIIDTQGKKSIECPRCGFGMDIPERTISMEKLRHVQDVKKFVEWQKSMVPESHGIGNVRCLIICPKCEQIIVCLDEFSFQT